MLTVLRRTDSSMSISLGDHFLDKPLNYLGVLLPTIVYDIQIVNMNHVLSIWHPMQ